MTLLAKTVEAEMAKKADKKVALRYALDRIEAQLLMDVGKYLGIKAPTSIIREAFLVASCFAARENKGILDFARFDDAQRIFKIVEGNSAAIRKQAKGKVKAVPVLRWNLLVLAQGITDHSPKGLQTCEEIVTAVLKLCRARLSQLFAGNGELQLGNWKGKSNGVA